MKPLIFLPLLLLAGCSVDTSPAKVSDTPTASLAGYHAICIDGIQYWTKPSKMAVRIDPNSLNPAKCIPE